MNGFAKVANAWRAHACVDGESDIRSGVAHTRGTDGSRDTLMHSPTAAEDSDCEECEALQHRACCTRSRAAHQRSRVE